jgi:hypothetical protein
VYETVVVRNVFYVSELWRDVEGEQKFFRGRDITLTASQIFALVNPNSIWQHLVVFR